MWKRSKASSSAYYAVPNIKSEDSLYMAGISHVSLYLSGSNNASYITASGPTLGVLDTSDDSIRSSSSLFHWHDPSLLTPERISFDGITIPFYNRNHMNNNDVVPFDEDANHTLSTSSDSSPYDHSYMPLDENRYLTWSYNDADGIPSFHAHSTSHPQHPVSPSLSILSASTDDSNLSPPTSLVEFSNAFDFDFNAASLPNDILPSTSPSSHWLQVPNLQQPQTSQRHIHQHCSSQTQSSVSTKRSKPRLGSRESSPNHSENDQNNPRRRFPCQIPGCARRFTSQYTLKVHVEAHKPKPRVSFPCTLGCSEKFSRQHDRLRHEVAKHGKICEFSCAECGRFFSSQKTLGNHKCPATQGTPRWVDT